MESDPHVIAEEKLEGEVLVVQLEDGDTDNENEEKIFFETVNEEILTEAVRRYIVQDDPPLNIGKAMLVDPNDFTAEDHNYYYQRVKDPAPKNIRRKRRPRRGENEFTTPNRNERVVSQSLKFAKNQRADLARTLELETEEDENEVAFEFNSPNRNKVNAKKMLPKNEGAAHDSPTKLSRKVARRTRGNETASNRKKLNKKLAAKKAAKNIRGAFSRKMTRLKEKALTEINEMADALLLNRNKVNERLSGALETNVLFSNEQNRTHFVPYLVKRAKFLRKKLPECVIKQPLHKSYTRIRKAAVPIQLIISDDTRMNLEAIAARQILEKEKKRKSKKIAEKFAAKHHIRYSNDVSRVLEKRAVVVLKQCIMPTSSPSIDAASPVSRGVPIQTERENEDVIRELEDEASVEQTEVPTERKTEESMLAKKRFAEERRKRLARKRAEDIREQQRARREYIYHLLAEETPEEREKCVAQWIETESAETHERRLRTQRLARKLKKDAETAEERQKRRKANLDRLHRRLAKETPERREWRRQEARRRLLNNKAPRKKEKPEQREIRLEKLRIKRANETLEERKKRLAGVRVAQRKAKENETPEKRAKRLEADKLATRRRRAKKKLEQSIDGSLSNGDEEPNHSTCRDSANEYQVKVLGLENIIKIFDGETEITVPLEHCLIQYAVETEIETQADIEAAEAPPNNVKAPGTPVDVEAAEIPNKRLVVSSYELRKSKRVKARENPKEPEKELVKPSVTWEDEEHILSAAEKYRKVRKERRKQQHENETPEERESRLLAQRLAYRKSRERLLAKKPENRMIADQKRHLRVNETPAERVKRQAAQLLTYRNRKAKLIAEKGEEGWRAKLESRRQQRRNETPEVREKRLAAESLYYYNHRDELKARRDTPEQREKSMVWQRRRKERETLEERERLRVAQRLQYLRAKERLVAEKGERKYRQSPEQRSLRRLEQLLLESPEQRDRRMAARNEAKRRRKERETSEDRERRRAATREYALKVRERETAEQREKRLAIQHKSWLKQMAKETEEHHAERLAKIRRKRADETAEQKAARCARKRERKANGGTRQTERSW